MQKSLRMSEKSTDPLTVLHLGCQLHRRLERVCFRWLYDHGAVPDTNNLDRRTQALATMREIVSDQLHNEYPPTYTLQHLNQPGQLRTAIITRSLLEPVQEILSLLEKGHKGPSQGRGEITLGLTAIEEVLIGEAREELGNALKALAANGGREAYRNEGPHSNAVYSIATFFRQKLLQTHFPLRQAFLFADDAEGTGTDFGFRWTKGVQDAFLMGYDNLQTDDLPVGLPPFFKALFDVASNLQKAIDKRSVPARNDIPARANTTSNRCVQYLQRYIDDVEAADVDQPESGPL
jgi:hypothetical protein